MGDFARFVELRPVLFGVAYRMLGSAAEADDIVQDAYLRWTSVDDSTVGSARAYLTTVVTRLSIDHLRSARVRRESYRGTWLPEPVLGGDDNDSPGPVGSPGSVDSLADSLSLAFLVLLEELKPLERAAFLLREVFGYGYGEIAETLDRNEASCRQLVSRARRRIGERRRRFETDSEQSRELVRRFSLACSTGDVSELMSLLTDDVIVMTDGGGTVRAAPRPVVGPWRSARFLVHVTKTFPAGVVFVEATINGLPGYLFELEGDVIHAAVFEISQRQIAGVKVVSNPSKLAALKRRLGSSASASASASDDDG